MSPSSETSSIKNAVESTSRAICFWSSPITSAFSSPAWKLILVRPAPFFSASTVPPFSLEIQTKAQFTSPFFQRGSDETLHCHSYCNVNAINNVRFRAHREHEISKAEIMVSVFLPTLQIIGIQDFLFNTVLLNAFILLAKRLWETCRTHFNSEWLGLVTVSKHASSTQ